MSGVSECCLFANGLLLCRMRGPTAEQLGACIAPVIYLERKQHTVYTHLVQYRQYISVCKIDRLISYYTFNKANKIYGAECNYTGSEDIIIRFQFFDLTAFLWRKKNVHCCAPLPTSQIAVYIHVCLDSCITVYVVKILKEINER